MGWQGGLISLMVCGWLGGCMTVFLVLGVGVRLCVWGGGGEDVCVCVCVCVSMCLCVCVLGGQV